MLYSKLFIPTLRDDHPLLVKAGYQRKRDYLFLGRRVLSKMVPLVRDEFATAGAQEFLAESLPALATHSREIRGPRHLPQLWYQFNRFTLEAIAFPSAPLAELSHRILLRCGIAAGWTPDFSLKTPDFSHGTPVRTADFSPRAASAAPPDDPDTLTPESFHTPNQKTIADIAAFTGVSAASQMKSVVMLADDKIVLALLRGDHQLDESKLKLSLLASTLRPATAAEIRDAFGADAGSLGPIGVNIATLCDDALEGRRNLICGANRNDYHLRNVTPGRDFEARFFNLRADPHPQLATITRAASLDADLLTLSLHRLLEHTIDQNRDADGIILPPAIAPFEVIITPVNISDDAQRIAAQKLYEDLIPLEIDALLDDRDERPGVKFKDSDLIGIPFRITVGKKLPQGIVELVTRRGRATEDIPICEIVATLSARIASCRQ